MFSVEFLVLSMELGMVFKKCWFDEWMDLLNGIIMLIYGINGSIRGYFVSFL